jgi:hypothetical protein
LEYIKRSFPADHKVHLQQEPMVPYNTDMYSGGHSRGNNTTLDQYISNAVEKNDIRLFDGINHNRLINLVFNKPTPPVFCQGSKVVTVTVTSDREKKWLFKTLWSKHFLETDHEIYYLPSSPEYCNFYSIVPVLTFGNQYKYDKSQKQYLYETYVLNNYTNSWYFDPDRFVEFDKTHSLNNVFIDLDTILTPEKFITKIEHIFDYLKLQQPDLNLIQKMHSIWLSAQLSYDL